MDRAWTTSSGTGPRPTRNPTFAFRFSGSFRFREAARAFRASWFQAPPRSGRRARASSVTLPFAVEAAKPAAELAADIVELLDEEQHTPLVEQLELMGETQPYP